MPAALASSFDWLARSDARVLILGSMPGVASLTQQQYYAHPRNAFWPIMQQIFDWPQDLTYADRCQALLDEKVAVWDVLKSCHRQGSLDSSIARDGMLFNNFQQFFQLHTQLEKILFNGNKAAQLFQRNVDTDLPTVTLPSTSPANARLTKDQKRQQWQAALADVLEL